MSEVQDYAAFFDKFQVPVFTKFQDDEKRQGLYFAVKACPCCSIEGRFMIERHKMVYYCGGKTGIPWTQARNMWRKRKEEKLLTLDNILDAPKQEWLIPDHLAKNLMTVIFGPTEVCKSFFELDRLLSIAYGVDYLGYIPTEQGRCLYLYAEGGSDGAGLTRRIAVWLKHHGIKRSDPRKKNIMFSTYQYDLSLDQQVDKLVDFVNHNCGRIDVLTIDTLAKNFCGKENDEMNQMVNAVCDLQARLNCAVDIIHHTGKDVGRGERGGSQLRAGVDNSIEIEGRYEGEQENLLSDVKVTQRKRKDGRKLAPYFLSVQEIELSVEPFDHSIVLVPVDKKDPTPADIKAKKAEGKAKTYMAAFEAFLKLIPTEWTKRTTLRGMTEKEGISERSHQGFLVLGLQEKKLEEKRDGNCKLVRRVLPVVSDDGYLT